VVVLREGGGLRRIFSCFFTFFFNLKYGDGVVDHIGDCGSGFGGSSGRDSRSISFLIAVLHLAVGETRIFNI
jgi:hypothetical protein